MWLLAQADGFQLPSLSPMVAYGPLGVLFALFVYFLYKYGSQWFESQIELLGVMKSCTQRNTENLEASTKNLDVLTKAFTAQSKIPIMLGHIAEAGKAATNDPEVHRHLDRALDERDR